MDDLLAGWLDTPIEVIPAVDVLGLSARGGLLRTGISMYSSREEIERLLAGLKALA